MSHIFVHQCLFGKTKHCKTAHRLKKLLLLIIRHHKRHETIYIWNYMSWSRKQLSQYNRFQTRLHTHSWQDFHNKITARRSVVNCTSIGQQVLLYFVSTVLQHIGHVLSNLLHHTVNKQETSNHAVLNTNFQHKMSVFTMYSHSLVVQTLRKQ